MGKRDKRNLGFNFLQVAAAGAAALSSYIFFIRPWHLRWGAAEEEIQRPLPGDELIPTPKVSATHAITIDAPPHKVWPWLVQMGQGRGGMYTYDWLENLMGLKMKSADRIIPEYQSLKVGDVIPFEPGGNGPPVVILDPNRALVMGGKIDANSEGPFKIQDKDPQAYFAVSWLFYLDQVEKNKTRLIERFKLGWYPANLSNAVYMYGLLEPGAFVMERKMLLGIKERAESGHN